jgi:hypothetical protein
MYRHFLYFIRTGETFEIDEPFGFDKATFKIKQERHARNLIIADFDEVELHRTLNHQFERVASELQLFGWETSIDYILQRNNVDFKIGQVDGATSIVFKDKIKLQITQDTLNTYIKRNENIEIDAFSDRDLKSNLITPCQTTSIYLNPKPVNQRGVWGLKTIGAHSNTSFGSPSFEILPTVNNLIDYKLETAFAPFDIIITWTTGGQYNDLVHANRLFTAKNDLSNVRIKIKPFNLLQVRTTNTSGTRNINVKWILYFDTILNPIIQNTAFYIDLSNAPINIDFPIDQFIDFPFIPAGASFAHYIEVNGNCEFQSYSSQGIEITATSTAIGSVIKAIRLKDYIKHKIESLGAVYNDSVFNTPLYNDNFVANGRMIGGLTDLPFTATFKNTIETFCDEAFADYEITDTNVNIKPVTDFYLNSESELLEIKPEHLHSIKGNEKLMLNTIEIGFKKSSKERTNNGKNTTDAIHTTAQYRLETEKVENIKKLDFDHIRDAFLIEETRRKNNEIEEGTTALENDENVFAIDCIPTPPAFNISFTRKLRVAYFVPQQHAVILSNGTFKWTNIGLSIGQVIQANGLNIQVLQLTDYQATFLLLGGFQTVNSQTEISITFNYVLQNVPYINRTNEGFALINGVDNPQSYSNLMFSLKRIFNRHSEWWLNAGQFIVGKNINVQKIAINDKLQSQLVGQSLVIDNAPTQIVDGGFMSGFILNCKVFTDFATSQNVTNNRNKFISVTLKNGIILSGWIIDFQYNFRSNTAMIDVNLTKESYVLGLPYILAYDL